MSREVLRAHSAESILEIATMDDGARITDRARRLLERCPGPLAVLDAGGTLTAASTAFVMWSGLHVDQLIDRRLDELWVVAGEPGSADPVPDLLKGVEQEALVSVRTRPAEPAVPESDEPPRGLRLFVLDADGGAVGVVPVDGAAREGRRRDPAPVPSPQVSVDELDVGLAVIGPDGSIEQVNAAMCRLCGRSREEMPATALLLTHPQDRVSGLELGVRACAGEIEGWTRSVRLVRPGGEVVWVQESAKVRHDAAGAGPRLVVEHIEIPAPRGAEAVWHECNDVDGWYVADALPVAVLEVDAEGRIIGGNHAARALIGHDPVGLFLDALVEAEDLPRLSMLLTRNLAEGAARRVEFRLRPYGEGRARWVRAQASVEVDREGRVVKSVSAWSDITDDVDARQSSDRLGDLLESVQDLVAVTDFDGRVSYLNGVGKTLLGDAPDGEVGDHQLAELFAPESADEIDQVALSTVRHFGSWQGEVRIVPPGMEPRVVSLSLVAHLDARSGVPSISAITRDITELKRTEEAIREQATTDVLTGLPNRAILFDRLGHALARISRSGGRLAVLFVDLDRFKAVNDHMGHRSGDELLTQVANRLSESVRACDTLARIGGDEFVVLVEPVTRIEEAMVVAERIVAALAKPFSLHAGPATIGASVGLAMSDPTSTPRTLLEHADAAVYQAKAAGRSCVAIYQE